MNPALESTVVIRRIGTNGQKRWAIPNEQMTGWERTFSTLLLFDATLDGTVPVMNNPDCHGGKCFGEASGTMKDYELDFPKDHEIQSRFEIGYNPRNSSFYSKSDSKETVGQVDILVLHEDGRSEAIFLKK
ncbi:hypothetical protein H7X65_00255 [Candidatus Parcubacteria bacterium]|nr:hypothetical protein [Candidatus Parcubacteria bacterium]